MRKTIGRSVAAAALAAAVVVPLSGVAQAAPQAPTVQSWDHHKCTCKDRDDDKGRDDDMGGDDDRGDWGGWGRGDWGNGYGGGLLSSLLNGLL
ncbi:hypothetical protein [Streptomyces niger]|uniref:hypothetical protein n=1 Tax=Streptomyces niger TaxID=66373 RepID=UPI00069B2269|nr:hypothetical protein [Streptomyces niger]